jgi:hypothetical protein
MNPIFLGPTSAGYLLAAVWATHGLWCKILGRVPRHRLIVARVLGERFAGPATIAVGVAEVAMASWILSGFEPYACAAAQTALLVSMNIFELTMARDLLLAPAAMAAANILFLSLAWYRALSGGA